MREELLAWVAARAVRCLEYLATAALAWVALRRFMPVTVWEVLAALLVLRALVRLVRGQNLWLVAVLLCVGLTWTSCASAARPMRRWNRLQLTPVRMEVTAYTAGPESTGKDVGHPEYGITASGRKVAHGTLAAPPSIPFGTLIYVPNYGWGVVWDRGGAIKEGHLDVFIADLRAALEWGRQELVVYIAR